MMCQKIGLFKVKIWKKILFRNISHLFIKIGSWVYTFFSAFFYIYLKCIDV